MIKKLNILAMAMLAAGATVTNVKAVPTYVATNVLQHVSATLTVYEQKPVSTPTIQPGVFFRTKDLLTAVESALGTNGTFDNHAILAILTTNTQVQTGTTTITNTNAVVTTTNILALSTNIVTIAVVTNSVTGSNVVLGVTGTATTNLTIGLTNGNFVTITATNGATNVTVSTVGPFGPTVTSYATNTVMLDANQTAIIGTNTPVPVETNVAVGATTVPIDTNTLSIGTNGVTTNFYVIGTNTLTFTTNSVTLGTNVYSFTTNAVVAIGPDMIGGSNSTGFGLTNTFTNSLADTFRVTNSVTLVTNNGVTNQLTTTNVVIIATTTDLSTNIGTNITITPVYGTNESSQMVVADGTVNTPIPTNILYIAEVGTNDIVGENSLGTTRMDWSIKRLFLSSTAVLTNAADNVTLSVRGLVHSTLQNFPVGAGVKVPITNETWFDVSGYGTNNGTPIVVGGTMSVGAPIIQKIP